MNAQHLQGCCNTKVKEGQSGCTLLKHNAIINGALKEAVRKDIISSNPVEKVILPKKKRFRGVAYTMEETRTLLNCSGDVPFIRLLFWVFSMACDATKFWDLDGAISISRASPFSFTVL